MVEEKEQIEISDIETFKGEGEKVFSKEALIMTALQKCVDAGSHEKRAGYYNEKMDNQGNVSRIYVEDTRLKFHSCIELASSLLTPDFDDETKKTMKMFGETIKRLKDIFLKKQQDYYEKLPPIPKQEMAGEIVEGVFSTKLGFYQAFIEASWQTDMDILTELMSLIKRLDYFKGEKFEA